MDDSQGGAIEFSVHKIGLINNYDSESHHHGGFQQRMTYYVENKGNISAKVRVALSDSSDPVSRFDLSE